MFHQDEMYPHMFNLQLIELSGSSGERKRRWNCRLCGKSLSSKRSYEEHANVHYRARPFECFSCDYAAASQMTLRRHILRNHTPRHAWRYQCPHCTKLYMEPASYKQHVSTHHSGKSATFGCPSEYCIFTTRCFSHFCEHIRKHRYSSSVGLEMTQSNAAKFLVDDDFGIGYREQQIAHSATDSTSSSYVRAAETTTGFSKPSRNSEVISHQHTCISKFTKLEPCETYSNQRLLDEFVDMRENISELSGNTLYIASDIDCLEVIVDGNSVNGFNYDGMIEPDLD